MQYDARGVRPLLIMHARGRSMKRITQDSVQRRSDDLASCCSAIRLYNLCISSIFLPFTYPTGYPVRYTTGF